MIEYRVSPVTRYIITRYQQSGMSASSCGRGEYDNAKVAYEVAHALCKAEHEAHADRNEAEEFRYPIVPAEYADEKLATSLG